MLQVSKIKWDTIHRGSDGYDIVTGHLKGYDIHIRRKRGDQRYELNIWKLRALDNRLKSDKIIYASRYDGYFKSWQSAKKKASEKLERKRKRVK